jgi:uncharacterized protein involved in cysteine biosynthesis
MGMPVLVGGALAGILTAVPLVNCFCCLWIIGGAMLAVHLYVKNSTVSLKAGDGAIVGVLAGIVAAVVDAFVSLPFEAINQEYVRKFMNELSRFVEEMPSGWEDWLSRRAGGVSPAWFLLSLMASAVIYAVFGALGGIIGSSLFGKKAAPPPPPQ